MCATVTSLKHRSSGRATSRRLTTLLVSPRAKMETSRTGMAHILTTRYQTQMISLIVEYVTAEISEVGEELVEDYWTPGVKQEVQSALRAFLREDWPVPTVAEGPRVEPATYETLFAATSGLHSEPGSFRCTGPDRSQHGGYLMTGKLSGHGVVLM